MNKQSYLFVTWEGGGNVPPVLGLARRVYQRGHRVRVLTEPCLREAVLETGADYIGFQKQFTRTDRTEDKIKDWNFDPLNTASFDNILINPARDVAEETGKALKSEKTDVLVADCMMIGSLFAAEAMGIPRVSLFHMPEYLPGANRPPGGLGLIPGATRSGRFRDKLATLMFNQLTKRYLPKLNAVRSDFDLPALETFDELFHQADLRLIQTSEAFDFPIEPAPANVRYTGAVLDDPDWASAAEVDLSHDDHLPLVVVSLSSTFQNQRQVIGRIIDALSRLEVRGVVTLGPAMSKETFQTPERIVLLSSASHSRIFPQASAVITHAGHGTVIRALAHGLPLVCLPMGRDQTDNAARVVSHGAGLKLSSRSKPAKIGGAVERVLKDTSFAHHARRLQQSILRDAGSDLAIASLENLLSAEASHHRTNKIPIPKPAPQTH